MQQQRNALSTLAALIPLFLFHPPGLLSGTDGIQPERTLRLLEALEPEYALTYTAQDLHVQDFLVRADTVYFLTRAVPKAGLPAAIARTDASGKLLGMTRLPESRAGFSVDADGEGNQYVVVQQDQTFRVYSSSGELISTRPVQAGINETCDGRRQGLDICEEYNPVLLQKFQTWQRQIYPRRFGDGFLLVDGHAGQLHFGNDVAGVTRSVTVSHPVLDEARSKSVQLRAGKSAGAAVIIGDAAVDDDKIYLLMGDGAPSGKAYVARCARDATFEALMEYALPALPGARVNPHRGAQPILPAFLEVAAGRLYICDPFGNVAVFRLDK